MKEHLKLVEKVKNYFPNINAENINKAYNFGKKAHGAQTRASGDPFFSHPFWIPQNAKMQMFVRCSNLCCTHSTRVGAPGAQGGPRVSDSALNPAT